MAPAAWAHTALVEARPADGSVVARAPVEVVLSFTGPIQEGFAAEVAVTAPGGRSVTAGPVRVQGSVVVQDVRALPGPGTYRVGYRVVSDDGHPVFGTYAFRYGPSGGAGEVGGPAPRESAPYGADRGAAGAEPSFLARHLPHGLALLGALIVGVVLVRVERRWAR
ncbi:MAG: copper resistance CopC family protein [Acidimicrobiia bacterium]